MKWIVAVGFSGVCALSFGCSSSTKVNLMEADSAIPGHKIGDGGTKNPADATVSVDSAVDPELDGSLPKTDGSMPAHACDGASDGAPCDDNDACTETDTCTAGVCVGGSALSCDDGNGCTDDTCDATAGCVFGNNTASCDDSDACTTSDQCVDGTCAGGPALACDDENGCTQDSCDAASGCVFDGSGVTTSCDSTDPCSAASSCQGDEDGTCAITETKDCSNLDDACHVGVCDPSTGACQAVAVADGTSCDDGNACTTGNQCGAGTCSAGSPLACEDNNGCTDDSCDPGSGCVFANNTASCDDGNACTTGDQCGAGTCTGGGTLACEDGEGCTDDSCDPGSGCVFANNTASCDDGNACTTGDQCGAGTCSGGGALACDDANPCTADGCNDESGCTNDGTGITSSCAVDDGCDVAFVCQGDFAGTCASTTLKDCSGVADACNAGICDGVSGDCVAVPVTNGVSCDTGDACEVDSQCSNGVCGGGSPLTCDDINGCTDDSCDSGTGCVFTNNTAGCDDGRQCTTGDQCNGGSCESGADPCSGDNISCADDSGSSYTCLCDDSFTEINGECVCEPGFMEVNGACVCDLNGTFAMQIESTMSWKDLEFIEDSNNSSNTSPVLAHSWGLRTHSYAPDGTLTIVTEQCGGAAPDLCGTGLPFGLAGPEAYAQYQAASIWQGPNMPTISETMSIVAPLPGSAFETPMNALLLGIDLTDPMGAWPDSRDDVGSGEAGSVNGAIWMDHDSDGDDGVMSYVVPPGGVTASDPAAAIDYGAASADCPRLSGGSSLGYAYLPAFSGGVQRIKRLNVASRLITSYSGQFAADTCDTISGTLVGPTAGTFFQSDARVDSCVRVSGSGEASCNSTVTDFFDDTANDTQQDVVNATFTMTRIAVGATCADVQAAF